MRGFSGSREECKSMGFGRKHHQIIHGTGHGAVEMEGIVQGKWGNQ
jgi:hypothetical protein